MPGWIEHAKIACHDEGYGAQGVLADALIVHALQNGYTAVSSITPPVLGAAAEYHAISSRATARLGKNVAAESPRLVAKFMAPRPS